jgi:hypothetical protein
LFPTSKQTGFTGKERRENGRILDLLGRATQEENPWFCLECGDK